MAEIYLQLTYLTMVGELVAACESIYHVADSIYHNMDYIHNSLILRQLLREYALKKSSKTPIPQKNITNINSQKLCRNTKQTIAINVFTIKYLYRFS